MCRTVCGCGEGRANAACGCRVCSCVNPALFVECFCLKRTSMHLAAAASSTHAPRPDWYLQDAVCGVRYETQDPYRGTDAGSCSTTLPRYTSGFTKYTAVADKSELGVARALMVNPVTIAIGVGGAAQNYQFQNYKTGVWSCGNLASSVDHAVAVIGYKKAQLMASGATWNVFRVKNSWNTNWGEQGFFNMRADCTGTGSLLMYANPVSLPMRQG